MIGRAIAGAAIRFYQRHLSHRKGYRCAHHALHGRQTCSGYGLRVIERFGLRAGLRLLDRRLDACADAYSHLHPANWRTRQAGFCDTPCDMPDVNPCEPVAHCEPALEVVDAMATVADCVSPCVPESETGACRREPRERKRRRGERTTS